MTYTFLTGHPPGGCPPSGLRGLPVTEYSDQFHALLQLQGMPEIAACFALPIKGPHSAVAEWFTPLEGPVIPWKEANETRQQQAIGLLQSAFTRLQALREQCLNSGYPAGLFYAELLDKIACFPGPDSLWLAGNQPVITGWGFRSSDGGAEELLQQMAIQLSPPDLPVIGVAIPVCHDLTVTAPLPEQVMTRRTPLFRRSRRRYAIPLVSGVLLTLLVVYGVSRRFGQLPLPPQPRPPAAVVKPPAPEEVTTSQKTLIAIHLPRTPAVLQPISTVHKPPVAQQKAPPERLKLPEQAQKAGDIGFMNGRWFALLKNGGQPVRLRFTYKDGQGAVVMSLSNNIRCQAKSQAGWLPSGKLSLRSRYRATCSNGRRQPVPDILCTRSGDNAACTIAENNQQPPRPVILYSREPE